MEYVEYIYLIREREFETLDQNVYKVGRSSRTIQTRMNSYPKESVVQFITRCHDSVECEGKIIKKFIEKFTHEKYGREYFSGDVFEMIDTIMTVIQDKPADDIPTAVPALPPASAPALAPALAPASMPASAPALAPASMPALAPALASDIEYLVTSRPELKSVAANDAMDAFQVLAEFIIHGKNDEVKQVEPEKPNIFEDFNSLQGQDLQDGSFSSNPLSLVLGRDDIEIISKNRAGESTVWRPNSSASTAFVFDLMNRGALSLEILPKIFTHITTRRAIAAKTKKFNVQFLEKTELNKHMNYTDINDFVTDIAMVVNPSDHSKGMLDIMLNSPALINKSLPVQILGAYNPNATTTCYHIRTWPQQNCPSSDTIIKKIGQNWYTEDWLQLNVPYACVYSAKYHEYYFINYMKGAVPGHSRSRDTLVKLSVKSPVTNELYSEETAPWTESFDFKVYQKSIDDFLESKKLTVCKNDVPFYLDL